MAIGIVETALVVAAATGAGLTIKRRGRRGKRRQFFASQVGDAQALVVEETTPTMDESSMNEDTSNSDSSLDSTSNNDVSHDGVSHADVTSAQTKAKDETGET